MACRHMLLPLPLTLLRAHTPAPHTAGGFSFMLPGSQQGQGQVAALTPGLPGMDLGGLPSGTSRRRASHADPHPHTGIRLSVARRLSEQAERRRSMHTPSTGGSGGPPSAGRPSPGGGGGAGGGAPGGGHQHHYSRVIELVSEDLLGEPDVDVAVVKVLSAPHGTPPDEATGSR